MRREFTPEVIAEIRRLHHDHPELGHEGIHKLLCDAGFEVEEYDLREYMDDHHMDPGPTATWKSKMLHRGPIGTGGL